MKNFILLSALFMVSSGLMAQHPDSLKNAAAADSIFNSMAADNKNAPVAIFESSKLILSQSTETVKKNNLNFMVTHRFGDFAGEEGGGKYLNGLDKVADLYIGF